MTDEIRELYEFNRWANHRMLDAAAGLDAEQFNRDLQSSFPSVQATLAHMLTTEWAWLQRWRGISPTGFPSDWEMTTLPSLRELWSGVEREQQEFLATIADGDLSRTIAYRNIAGEAFEAPLWQLLRHVVNHSTYHRGQVATMLRQLGSSMPATDLGLFYREQDARRAAATQGQPA